ncbi:MAG: 50S ribosomal protein L11 methyltransferase, partial [Betaproteobacteria bacterium]|nr:50S ribosomal protein L11 methyltransferase [Betaproteobacteria bacterium]
GDAYAGTPRECARFNEPGEPGAPSWELARVSILFDEQADIAAAMSAALEAAGYDPAQSYAVERIEDKDWVRAVQAEFRPVAVSPRMWVVPTWHVAPDAGAINLIIDPGLAFGTGTHPTTRLCLEWLDRNLPSGASVLDYGCGSGILAIAAMKLGAGAAIGIDIDPAAVLAARNNAMQNQAAVRVEGADHVVNETYDVVVANILANPLKLLAPLLARAARAGGHVVLSGILDHQAAEVRACYDEWFDMNFEQHEDGWVLLVGCRR